MDTKEQNQFAIMCDTAMLIITNYVDNKPRFMPNWLFQKRKHQRIKEVEQIQKSIATLKTSISVTASYKGLSDELIKMLMNHYYFLCVHVVSKQLRSIVQDALLACLNFSENDVAVYHNLIEGQRNNLAYINHFQKAEELTRYLQHFKNRHVAYGVPLDQLKKDEIYLVAKGGLIHGMLVERFGIRPITRRGIIRVKKELQDLINRKVENGFLTLNSAEGYINKIDMLIEASEKPEIDEETLLRNARNLLETIINTAGILSMGVAKYPEHGVLISSCYWVDEYLLQARAKLEVV